MIDPDVFIITRKRKKYKFARFANAANCFEFADWIRENILQQEQRPIVAEVGAGTGLFSVELAARYPDHVFVALDVKADRLQKGAYSAIEQNLENVFFVRARADQINEVISDHSLSAIWVTFPDPFPRKRSSGRRLTHPAFLRRYSQALAESHKGKFSGLYIKHDNLEFFNWTLEQLVADSWHIKELSFDLHDSDMSDDYKILTTYEKRWLDEGRKVGLVRAETQWL